MIHRNEPLTEVKVTYVSLLTFIQSPKTSLKYYKRMAEEDLVFLSPVFIRINYWLGCFFGEVGLYQLLNHPT